MSCFQTLKQKGYRLTLPRVMVLEVLHKHDGHISAEDIYSQVHAEHPTVNKSTVYRTLELLKSLGLVVETDFGKERLYYHHTENGHHHHLVCRVCGKVFEVDESLLDSLAANIREEYGFEADLRHLGIFGQCASCATSAGESVRSVA